MVEGAQAHSSGRFRDDKAMAMVVSTESRTFSKIHLHLLFHTQHHMSMEPNTKMLELALLKYNGICSFPVKHRPNQHLIPVPMYLQDELVHCFEVFRGIVRFLEGPWLI